MDVMERFERLSRLFVSRFMNPAWEACGDVDHDGWASLRLFLLGYAFERHGRSADYAPAAADTIDEMRGNVLTANMAAEGWHRFAEKLNNERLNHANNPMCPRGTRYKRRYRRGAIQRTTLATTGQPSAVEFAAQLQQPLVAWAREKITRDETRGAHTQLRSIVGISDKLASFFLRDVAVRYNLAPQNDRHLLQPIDTWVEFVVKKMSHGEGMTRAACAQFIVENANAPERANQGMWYFCVPVAGSSRYVVRRCLEDNDHYEAAVDHHLSRLKTGGAAAQGFNEEKAE